MTIQEALNSGKLFRNRDWDRTESYDGWYKNDCERYSFTRKQLLSNDWEVDEEAVTITRPQLDRAWQAAIRQQYYSDRSDALAKELGFK